MWFEPKRNYAGAYYDEGFSNAALLTLASELADALPHIFCGHALSDMWGYKQGLDGRSLSLHATVLNTNPIAGLRANTEFCSCLLMRGGMMSAVGGRPVRMRGTATNSGAGDGGIQVHADAAAVNVNIWLNDPDDNAVDSAAGVAGAEPGIAAGSSGAGAAGLLVYKREPPSDWGPDKWNQGAHAGRWLEETNAPRVRCRPPIYCQLWWRPL